MPDCPADWQPTPEQIAADQRRDVAQAVEDLGVTASVLAVSERTGLHPFVVVRRVRELGLGDVVAGMDWKPPVKEKSEKQKAQGTKFLKNTRKAAGKAE